jgi:hypothetical protein
MEEPKYLYQPLEKFGEGLTTNRPWNITALQQVELLNGRVAMLGFMVGLIAELLTGRGILSQLLWIGGWFLGGA